MPAPPSNKGVWTSSEHERFLEVIALYPHGPWTLITEHIGTRSAKQVQTHAQKYQHKLLRHERGLLKRKTKSSRLEHRVDQTTADHLRSGFIVRPTHRSKRALLSQGTFSRSSAATTGGQPASFNGWSTSSATSDDGSDSSESSYACHSPRAMEELLGNIQPLPFAPRVDYNDDETLFESVQFLEVCGFLSFVV